MRTVATNKGEVATSFELLTKYLTHLILYIRSGDDNWFEQTELKALDRNKSLMCTKTELFFE